MTAVRSRRVLELYFKALFAFKGETYMENEILYSSAKEQVEKLLSQNLIIENKQIAAAALQSFGYSNLIKSYRDPYIIKIDGKKVYRDGVSFDQVSSLYFFDKALRNAVMASMQDLEEHIKEIAANVVAQSFGVHQDDYLSYRNYQNKRKRKPRFSLSGILNTMRDSLDTDKEPIHHYQEKYGYVPPWVLFKSIYFSTITNLIDQFKAPQQKLMVSYLYDSNKLNLSDEALCKLMMDTLFICIDYRNMSAHGGRMYNYESPSRLRVNEIWGENTEMDIRGLKKLLFVLSIFEYQSPYHRLNQALENELTRHCSQYPEDITYLGQVLNVNITQQKIVWVSKRSNKFHSNRYCSGIKDAKGVNLEDAQSNGFIPCQRCCKP